MYSKGARLFTLWLVFIDLSASQTLNYTSSYSQKVSYATYISRSVIGISPLLNYNIQPFIGPQGSKYLFGFFGGAFNPVTIAGGGGGGANQYVNNIPQCSMNALHLISIPSFYTTEKWTYRIIYNYEFLDYTSRGLPLLSNYASYSGISANGSIWYVIYGGRLCGQSQAIVSRNMYLIYPGI